MPPCRRYRLRCPTARLRGFFDGQAMTRTARSQKNRPPRKPRGPRHAFSAAVLQRTAEAEAFLNKHQSALRLVWHKTAGGRIVVTSHLDLDGMNLDRLPDFSHVTVKGDFRCARNSLKNLQGAPRQVDGNFVCSANPLESLAGAPRKTGGSFQCMNASLTTLAGAPRHVGGTFHCARNRLETLDGGPESVGDSYICNDNLLVTLKGAPRRVPRHFRCHGNRLASLEHAPAETGGDFNCAGNDLATLKGAADRAGMAFVCTGNPLLSLEHAPRVFDKLCSPFGDFDAWDDVPAPLKFDPATLEREAQEAATLRRAIPLPRGPVFRRGAA